MADEKTVFQTGTTVSAEWLNSHYVTNGGHKHDGGDGDGHAGKIDPIGHITGVSEGEFTLYFDPDSFVDNQSCVVSYIRREATDKNPAIVQLSFPSFTAESAKNRFYYDILGNKEIPEGLRPQSDVLIPVGVIDNGIMHTGAILIMATGGVEFFLGDSMLGWSETGQKGFPSFIVQYPVGPSL